MKETRERREKEKAEREARRQAALSALKEEQAKQKGFQVGVGLVCGCC
jgi:kinesin family protein 4/21/27